MWTLALRFWKPLACVVVILLAWLAVHHFGATRFSAGYQQATSEDAKALSDWQIKYDAIVAQDQARLQLARRSHELEIAQLAVAARKPLPSVRLCSDTRLAGPVSAPTVISGGADPAAGLLPGDFVVHPDLTPALDLLVQRADKLSADARELNSAAHP